MQRIDLDSKEKKMIKRYSTYFGVGLLVLALTMLLVYAAQGYDIDRKTGEVIQNGLVIVSSTPDGATISLNSEKEEKLTDTRVSIPEGNYTVDLNKDGYRTWTRKIEVAGTDVVWLNYPFLIPEQLKTMPIDTFNNLVFMESSPFDSRIITHDSSRQDKFVVIETKDSGIVEVPVKLPAGLLSSSKGSFNFLRWSDNEKIVIIEHVITKSTSEYLYINIDEPDRSVNLSKVFADIDIDQIKFMSGEDDELLILAAKKLRYYNVSSETFSKVLANNVVSFVPYDDGAFLVSASGKGSLIFVDLNRLRTLAVFDGKSEPLMIAAGKYDGKVLVAIGKDDGRVEIYANPRVALDRSAKVSQRLALNGLSTLRFSEGSQFLSAQAANRIVLYDFEDNEKLAYSVGNSKKVGEASWVDNHHLVVESDSAVYVYDYDGSNQYPLLENIDSRFAPVITSDMKKLYTATTSSKTDRTTIGITSLELQEN